MDIEYNEEFYNNFRKFVIFYMNTVYDIKVNGLENIDRSKSYLLAGNHLNILDSWLLVAALDENLRFMVDKKLYRYRLWEKFFKSLGTFETDPNSNNNVIAVKTAINLLKNNSNVVIFPEGKTHRITESVPFKPGVPAIARLARASLIPFGINGSYFPGGRLELNIGEPIELSNYKKDEYDQVLEEKVRKLEKRF